jgi:hypothetical protein
MRTHPSWWRFVVLAVAISTLAIVVRTGGTSALDPLKESGRIAAVAEQQMVARGYDGHLSDVLCNPEHGGDPSRASNWTCSGLDRWGDLVRFTASERWGTITVDPISGVTDDQPRYVDGSQTPPVP